MSDRRRWLWWLAGTATALGVAIYLGWRLFGGDRAVFVPGEMTSGHHQIEQACEACHTPFGGVRQEACTQCHGAALAAANDSHPKSKFDDPRNADRLTLLDARWCVACHVEHRPERTRAMGVTLPGDFCFHCHADIGEERPSHRGLPFDGCASAGCHNYHDNTALYEDFLVKHLGEPDLSATPRRPARGAVAFVPGETGPRARLRAADADAPPAYAGADAVRAWAASAHARAGINCSDCHRAEGRDDWIARPAYTTCASCHDAHVAGFLDGKHGMRLKSDLPPMTPAQARLPMHAAAGDRALGCESCHAAHDYDTRPAAAERCLNCHDDPHSRAFRDSPHGRLWAAELSGAAPPGAGVACATCHMPRLPHAAAGGHAAGTLVTRVEHNQNFNLQPNEKMLRSACLHCHGLGFALDALADPELVRRNFNGRPARHVESLDMAAARAATDRKTRQRGGE